MAGAFLTGYKDKRPSIHGSVFVDISARIIGDVIIEQEASVWPGAVLRADSEPIHVHRRSAVLDLALLEAPSGRPVVIGEDVLISHGAIVHGAQIQSHSLVGIGAIILDGALVGSGSIVGAGSLVTAGTQIPPNSLVIGSPGRVIRETKGEEKQTLLDQLDELQEKARELKKEMISP